MIKFCRKCKSETERYKSGECQPCKVVSQKAWAAANPEKIKAKDRAWAMANTDKTRESTRTWAAANPEKIKSMGKAYREANPEARRANDSNRRALKKASTGQHSASDIKAMLILQKRKCICCKVSIKDGYHVDHIYPIIKGGNNDKYNLQLMCPTCNMSKGAKHPIDFMQSRGFLL